MRTTHPSIVSPNITKPKQNQRFTVEHSEIVQIILVFLVVPSADIGMMEDLFGQELTFVLAGLVSGLYQLRASFRSFELTLFVLVNEFDL